MAGLNEMAFGIATVLISSPVPEPLSIQLMGQTLKDAADLIIGVARECSDAGIQLHRIQVDDVLFSYLRENASPSANWPLETGSAAAEVRFFRKG